MKHLMTRPPSDDDIKTSSGELPALPEAVVGLGSGSARKLFVYLTKSFEVDYVKKRYSIESSGWRTLVESANAIGLSRGVMYGSAGGFSPFVNELIRTGTVESRIFPGERGRGGNITRVRIAYDREPVQLLFEKSLKPKRDAVIGILKLDARRVAVLPFANYSPSKEDDYLADGMTEELISVIARIEGVETISRSSVMQYKGAPKSIREIAMELQVGTVLEGSIRRSGRRLRTSVQMIDTSNDRHLWAETYDKEFRDVFDIQNDIATRVAQALRSRIGAKPKSTKASGNRTGATAHIFYLKGRYFWADRTEAGLMKAVQYFRKAIDRDPEYALAYSGLADCYSILGNNGYLPPEKSFPIAKSMALKAVSLDPDSPEAHTSFAISLTQTDWDYEKSDLEFGKAIKLDPSYAFARHFYAGSLNARGRHRAAIEQARAAQRLDPLSPVITANAGIYHVMNREYDKGIELMKRALEMDPDSITALGAIATTCGITGKFEEGERYAKRYAELLGPSVANQLLVAYLDALSGKKEKARTILNKALAVRDEYIPREDLVQLQIALGESESVINMILEALKTKEFWAIRVVGGIYSIEILRDPRLAKAISELGAQMDRKARHTANVEV